MLVHSPPGQDLALPPKQEGVPMFSVDLSTRGCDSHMIVGLRGELDVTDAAAAALARGPKRPVLAGDPALAVAT